MACANADRARAKEHFWREENKSARAQMIMCYSGFSGFGGDRVEPRVGRFVFLKVPKAFRDSSQIELRHLCPNKDYMTIRDICIYIYI